MDRLPGGARRIKGGKEAGEKRRGSCVEPTRWTTTEVGNAAVVRKGEMMAQVEGKKEEEGNGRAKEEEEQHGHGRPNELRLRDENNYRNFLPMNGAP